MFRAHKPPPPPTGRQGKSLHSPGKLDIKEFKTTMAEVLGTHKYDGQLENLFNKVCLFLSFFFFIVIRVIPGLTDKAQNTKYLV